MKRKLKRPSCAFSAVLSSMATPPAATAGVVLFDVEETGRGVDEVVAGVRGVVDDAVGAGMESADVLNSAITSFTCIGRGSFGATRLNAHGKRAKNIGRVNIVIKKSTE